MSSLIRRSLVAAALATLALSVSPAQALYTDMRDLYPKSFNPDGTFNCARWCGLLESCC